MSRFHTQEQQEPMVDDLQDPDALRPEEVWQDIANQYRADHTGPESVLAAVEELLLDLGEALAERAACEATDGNVALARRTRRYGRNVQELYRQAETVPQAQMALLALQLGAPEWLFDQEDGEAWRREIQALRDYATWAASARSEADGT